MQSNIAFLNHQIKQIDEAIKRHYDEHPGLKQEKDNLQKVSGVVSRISSYLLVEMHRWND